MSESVLIAVARRGDLSLFQAIINDFEGSRTSLITAKTELLKFSYIGAAENGQLNILEYAISTGLLRINDKQSFFCSTLMEIASQFGYLEILKWFYPRIKRNYRTEVSLLDASILGNQMHTLEWTFESIEWYKGEPNGDLDREIIFDSETMMVARASGHGNLIMVKFLIDKGFEYRHTVVTQAADCCKWKS